MSCCQQPSKNVWDRHICVPHRETEDTGGCILRSQSDTGAWVLYRRTQRLKLSNINTFLLETRQQPQHGRVEPTGVPNGLRTFRLAQGVVDLDGFDGLPGVEKLHPLSASRLVSTSKWFGLTVRPIDKVLEQSQSHYPLDVIVGHWRGTNGQSKIQLNYFL